MNKSQPNISELESAIRQLDSVKKHLYYTSSQIKTQIHSSISRHLEALRNREVWLLSQVDLVLSAKEEVLQHQQARLNKTFGILQSSLALSEDSDGLHTRLADKLSTLDFADLKPEETPYLSFCADQVGLREAILNYGRVDANGIPLQTAFIDQENSSTCMPGHFEDYEDADHHIFYKTVEEISRSRRPSGSIRVNIPKLSTRAEDWLYQPPGCKTVSTATVPKFSFPAFSRDPQDWVPSGSGKDSSPRMYGDSCIQNWLSQIQQCPAFEEEDDFEIVGSSLGERTPPVIDKPFFETFPLTTKTIWLKSSRPDPGQEKWNREARSWFAHIPSDTEVWLAKGKKKMEQKAASSDTSSNSSRSPEAEKPDNNVAIMDAFFKDLPKTWLKGENSKSRSTWTNLFKKDDGLPVQNAADNFEWLKKGNKIGAINQKADAPIVSFFQPLQLEKKKWIKSGVDDAKNTFFRQDFTFFDTVSKNPTDWLKQRQPVTNKNIPGLTFFNFESDSKKLDGTHWLKSADLPCEAISVPECLTWKVVQNMHSKMSENDWLLKIQGQEVTDVEAKIDEEISDDGDAWNLCHPSNHGDEFSPQETHTSSLGHWLL